MNDIQMALELRKALQFFLETLDADTDVAKILEIPTAFPAWKVGVTYKTKAVISYGVNEVGDPQLYQVLQEHTSKEEHKPDTATSLYKAIGITEDGYPEWVQPLGATDAYEMGDIVSHNGVLWECTAVDGGGKNSWEPGVYGWTELTSEEV